MSTKYQKPYTIPEGFPALLKGFTREILRSQPENIYQFGAEYFANLKASGANGALSDMGAATKMGPHEGLETGIKAAVQSSEIGSMSTNELEPILMQLFMEADADRSGFLDKREFTNVLNSAHLNLSDRQIRSVMAEADENDDGVIEYREFVPFMVDVIQGMRASDDAAARMAAAEDVVRSAVEDMLLNGMSRGELQSLMLRIFRKADADGSGRLSSREFRGALRAARLGLTRKDINLIMFRVDANNDGEISYEEFVPVCFQVLVERFKDKVVAQDVLTNQDGLQGLLLQAFQDADHEGTGLLPIASVKSALRTLSFNVLGLSTLQLVTLISRAPTSADGLVQYIPFVPLAAAMVHSMYDVDRVKLRIQAIKEMADAGGLRAMLSVDLDALRSELANLFADADAGGTGLLSEDDVRGVLSALAASGGGSAAAGLSDHHLRAMFTAIDVDDRGCVDWQELVGFICDAIEHLEREKYIDSVSGEYQEE